MKRFNRKRVFFPCEKLNIPTTIETIFFFLFILTFYNFYVKYAFLMKVLDEKKYTFFTFFNEKFLY